MCGSMVDIQFATIEIRRGIKKKIERNYRMKIYMVSLLHRATIITDADEIEKTKRTTTIAKYVTRSTFDDNLRKSELTQGVASRNVHETLHNRSSECCYVTMGY